uniref:Uncharacterized protein n=1 Tax=Rhizophora mucronata TaxID=61149 RepID=A0A2P2JH60_RHIMU
MNDGNDEENKEQKNANFLCRLPPLLLLLLYFFRTATPRLAVPLI